MRKLLSVVQYVNAIADSLALEKTNSALHMWLSEHTQLLQLSCREEYYIGNQEQDFCD